jgi:hypothetical protein
MTKLSNVGVIEEARNQKSFSPENRGLHWNTRVKDFSNVTTYFFFSLS